MSRDIENLLNDIGFSMQEAAIYIALLINPHSTGYKIAKEIGKSFSNTYKGLDSLNKKGAVIVDDSQRPQKFTAVPISDYLDFVEKNLSKTRKKLEDKLKNIEGDTSSEGIYIIETIDQVFSRARNMIDSAKFLIVIDAYQDPLDEIKDALERAIERNVKVFIHTYAPYNLKGAKINWYPENARLKPFPWNWLNLVVDTSEILLSYIDDELEHLYQAFWSRNPYLGNYVHNGTMHEFMVESLRNMLYDGLPSSDILDGLNRLEMEYYGDGNWLYHFYGLFMKPEDDIRRQPAIVDSPEIFICGYDGHNDPGKNVQNELWKQLYDNKETIDNIVNSDRYYLIRQNVEMTSTGKSYDLIVGKQVSSLDNIPEGMVGFTIPSRKYAKFTHRGLFYSQLTYAYIHQKWLPDSEYTYDNSVEFELFDSNFKPNESDSEMYIFIPINLKEG